MHTEMNSDPPLSQLPQDAEEITRQAAATVKDVAWDFTHPTAKDLARRATDTAKDMYQSAALKAGDTLATSKECVRQNPARFVLGALALGAAIGCLLTIASRKPTFSERYADEPLNAMREAILGALAPVAHRVHEGYDSALDGAGKLGDRVSSFRSGRNGSSLSRLGRIGSNLKFW